MKRKIFTKETSPFVMNTMVLSDYKKLPRLYGDYALDIEAKVVLSDDHCHYLLCVMRKNDGDQARIFNGRDGEFVGQIVKTGKKTASLTVIEKIKDQDLNVPSRHLYFAPIKKDRLGFLIEKSVELGVTDFHPIMTDHTENRYIKADKIQKQIIEAAEQCERLDIPQLHPMVALRDIDYDGDIYCALERHDNALFTPEKTAESIAILVGPEGGWSVDEADYLMALPKSVPVSLGPRILRAETAAVFMLSRIV